ncbi:hypothetical protein EDB84DRAFT_505484 [Lactarius hengduanensis]|nr:hypothetical protein EDB84DRAFT_505484 [Lactarius hengduanensis]
MCATLPVSPGWGYPCATSLADLNIGALAGTVARTVSYPFEVVRWRMQVGGLTEPGRYGIWPRGDNKRRCQSTIGQSFEKETRAGAAQSANRRAQGRQPTRRPLT